MKHYKKIILTLVALLALTTGAWATPNSIVINGTPQVGDKSISLTYHFDPNNVPGITPYVPTLKVKCAADNKWDETLLSFPEVSSGTTNISLNTLGEFEAGKTYEVCFAYNNGNWVDEVFQSFVPAGPATFPFPITWDAKNKTTGFSLPAGNVFMNVEYYPAAAVATAPAAKSDIKATTDDAIVTAGTVAKIGETENAQGTLMYYAVQSETVPDAPDYDNQGWSDKVPTAADFNQGNVYVWYYVKGADGDAESTFNDGAITKLGETGYVTLAAPPTYAITLKEDTEEADKWTISSAEATKGTTVTVTYTGQKKILGVKAEKKAGTPKVGQIIGSDGKNYDANATLPSGVTAVAMIAYVGSETGVDGYTHGLALALADESSKMNWSTAAGASGAAAHTPAAPTTITSSWMLPSKDQWNKMIEACKNVLGTKNNYQDLRDGFSGIAGASNLQSDFYWSSTESESGCARDYRFDKGGDWYNESKDYKDRVRACLAF